MERNDIIEGILRHNREFVDSRGYEPFATSKYPDKKIAIVACMDTRLVTLLPAALGLKNGDVKMIKNAGGRITGPFDSAMVSILVAVYELGVDTVMVIGHTGCGVEGMNAAEMTHLMESRGIPRERIELLRRGGVDLDAALRGFDDVEGSVRSSVDIVAHHPLLPSDVKVLGYVMDTPTGLLRAVE